MNLVDAATAEAVVLRENLKKKTSREPRPNQMKRDHIHEFVTKWTNPFHSC